MSDKKSTRPEEKPQPETFYAGRGSRQIGKREDPTEPPTPLLPPTPEEKFLKRQAPREPKPAPKNDDEQPASTLTRPRVGSSRVGSSVLIGAPDELLEAYEQAVLEAEAEEESQQSENERRESQRRGRVRKLSPLSTLEAVRDGLLFIFGKFLRLVRRLDMHGGGTGNNINFVEGLIDFLAGSLGGAAQVYVSQPLDTVKVKLQTFPEAYKGLFDCFVSTYRTDGIFRSLYAGSLPAVVANVAENSVLFAAYGGCQKFVAFMVNKETTSQLTTTQNACAGSLAACFSTLTLCPTELIKCKLQALREMKHYIEPSHPQDMRTPWSLTRYIWRTEEFTSDVPGSLQHLAQRLDANQSAEQPEPERCGRGCGQHTPTAASRLRWLLFVAPSHAALAAAHLSGRCRSRTSTSNASGTTSRITIKCPATRRTASCRRTAFFPRYSLLLPPMERSFCLLFRAARARICA